MKANGLVSTRYCKRPSLSVSASDHPLSVIASDQRERSNLQEGRTDPAGSPTRHCEFILNEVKDLEAISKKQQLHCRRLLSRSGHCRINSPDLYSSSGKQPRLCFFHAPRPIKFWPKASAVERHLTGRAMTSWGHEQGCIFPPSLRGPIGPKQSLVSFST
jgi:hypothetical protein